MIRLLAACCAAVFALLSTSCLCCTGEASAPELRPLPAFQELPAAPEVHYAK